MHLVEIGHGTVLFGHFDDLFHRADVAIHRVDALKGHDLGGVGGQGAQLAVQVLGVVMPPDHLFRAAVADAFDHAGVVQLVREDHRIGQARAEGRESGPVRDITRGKEQRRLLAMQIGQLPLQHQMVMRCARDVARAARTRAAGVDRVFHRLPDGGMLTHAEVVVGTPDRDFFGGLGIMAPRLGEGAALPLQFRENAIVAFLFQRIQLRCEHGIKIHDVPPVLIFQVLVWARAASSARVLHPAMAAPSTSVREAPAP